MHADLRKVLKAPGNGLLTVTTGSAAAQKTLAPYFKKTEWINWSAAVEARLGHAHPFYILGFPSDSGGGICRGAAHGPLALRAALYRKHRPWARRDLGDIPCIPQLVHDSMLNDAQLQRSRQALWSSDAQGLPVSPLNILEEILVEMWSRDASFRPLILGGDHSVSGAIFSALARQNKLAKTAVLHIDAHTDLLESRFGVEHCFGTWTSHALRKMPDPKLWVQVGIRTSRHDKAHWEKTYGLQQFWARELLKQDPRRWAADLVKDWRARGATQLYITHDIDGTDAAAVPATGTPEPRGLPVKWLETLLRELSRELPLIGSDLVEVAPVLGAPAAAQKTLKVAVKYLEALHWH